MERNPYPSDLTDRQWSIIEPLIPAAHPGGRHRSAPMRRIVDGNGTIQDLDELLAVAGDMEGVTICVFADAAAWPVQSYITKFRDEFEEYIRQGRSADKTEAQECPA